MIKLANLLESDPCWKGYKQIGMKDKNGKEVPNCVPNESVVNELGGLGKMQKLYMAVSEKLRTMQINQLAMFEKYKKETDPKKKAELMDMLKKGTKNLEATRNNLSDIEEKYVMNLDKDMEIDSNSNIR